MKAERAIVAERALARHSAALLRPGPEKADVLQALARAADRMARTLRGAMARLCGGYPPEVAIAAPREIGIEEFQSEGLTAYSIYSVLPGLDRLASAIDGEAVLRLVDRTFGGPGEAPRPMPRELPMSAELMVQRIETILSEELGRALGGSHAIRPLRRDRDLAQLQPFASATRLALLEITISEGSREPWPIRLVLPVEALSSLTGMGAQPATSTARAPAKGDPLAEPYGAMPLPVTALLVDTRVPLRTVSTLAVGQVLMLPIARSVPLVVGGQTVGHGAIGAVDDRVAIEITHLP